MRWNKKLKSASLYLILSVIIKGRINVIIRSPFTPLHFFYPFSKNRNSRQVASLAESIVRRTSDVRKSYRAYIK